MRTFGSFLRSVVSELVLMIPISAGIAGIVWFISNVLAGQGWSFLVLWRNSYLVPALIFFALHLVRMVNRYALFILVAKRLGRPFGVIEAGYLKYKLYKQKRASEWTTEWFDTHFVSAQVAEKLADQIIESLGRF